MRLIMILFLQNLFRCLRFEFFFPPLLPPPLLLALFLAVFWNGFYGFLIRFSFIAFSQRHFYIRNVIEYRIYVSSEYIFFCLFNCWMLGAMKLLVHDGRIKRRGGEGGVLKMVATVPYSFLHRYHLLIHFSTTSILCAFVSFLM